MATTGGHTIKAFDDDLDRLRALISEMGGLAEHGIRESLRCLVERDSEGARRVVEEDRKLDALEIETERRAVQLIALRAPMAGDLRDIVAALKISSVVERIGDYAKNIAKRASALAQAPQIQPVVIVPEMARVVAQMVKDALDAFVDRDVELAIAVTRRDQSVDDFYNSLFRSLLTFMMENPQHITPSTHLLFIAKNLERIGDHATNVAEFVHFSATGEHIVERPKSDETSYTTYSQPYAGPGARA